jgi:hypothetical protein
MTRTKFSSGGAAPTSMRPLMKNAGVYLAGLGFRNFFLEFLGQIFDLVAGEFIYVRL